MRSIGDFFSKIKNKQAQEVFLRTIVQQVLKKVANVDCDIGDIGFKGFHVNLKNVSQVAKSQLFLKKQKILQEIAVQSPGRTISDIKFG